jgi:hypothetical protein
MRVKTPSLFDPATSSAQVSKARKSALVLQASDHVAFDAVHAIDDADLVKSSACSA